MIDLIPFLDMDSIRVRAEAKIRKNDEKITAKRMNAYINRIIFTELQKLPELPPLYYQGKITENAMSRTTQQVQTRILGIKPSSRLFILDDNPFEDDTRMLFDNVVEPQSVKWLPYIQTIHDSGGDIEFNFILAGAEFESPDIIGYPADVIDTNTLGKKTLEKFEE